MSVRTAPDSAAASIQDHEGGTMTETPETPNTDPPLEPAPEPDTDNNGQDEADE